MGAPWRVPFAAAVAPGSTVDVSVTMTAPTTPGSYTGEWSLRKTKCSAFGGSAGKGPLWVQIEVGS
ncbi:MAG: NBR1-Ig-like domain-containing protein [Chloroflexi bacterium]|nr:NBR1-Ig-like domain-containing protein [Chloroflexota bacterium]